MKYGLIYSVSGNFEVLEFTLSILEKEYGINENNILSLGNLIGYYNQNQICVQKAINFSNCMIGRNEKVFLSKKINFLRESRYNYFEKLKKNLENKQVKKFKVKPIVINGFTFANSQNIEMLSTYWKTRRFASKKNMLNSPIWEFCLYETQAKLPIIFGGYQVPTIFMKNKTIKHLSFRDNHIVKLNTEIQAISIGAVGFSKYFSLGYVNFAVLKEDTLELCSRRFNFNIKGYSILNSSEK